MNIPINFATLRTVVGVAVAIVSTAFFIDGRYAHATDVESLRLDQAQIIKKNKQEIRAMWKHQLEDKIFELKLKSNPTRNEKALIDHYQNQLNDLQDSSTTPTDEGEITK